MFGGSNRLGIIGFNQIVVTLTIQAVTEARLDGNFQPGFRKDLRLALEAGREQAVPLFATANVAELMNAMIAQGMGDLDHSGLAALYARLGGLD